MHKLSIAFLIVALTPPTFGAKLVTVEQLSETVLAANSKPDTDAARQISDLRLTERLSASRLARLRLIAPGERSREALQAVADESAFLRPPESDAISNPAPDLTEQRRMMAKVVAYVSKAIGLLPNFLATRQTTHF